jgi:hypothetical protein
MLPPPFPVPPNNQHHFDVPTPYGDQYASSNLLNHGLQSIRNINLERTLEALMLRMIVKKDLLLVVLPEKKGFMNKSKN